jgi:hypothetical protein
MLSATSESKIESKQIQFDSRALQGGVKSMQRAVLKADTVYDVQLYMDLPRSVDCDRYSVGLLHEVISWGFINLTGSYALN